MIVVDASVWVSYLHQGDDHHQSSRHWLADQLAAGETICIPTLALVEVAGAMARATGNVDLGPRVVGALLRVPRLQIVALDPELARDGALLAARLRLRGADAVYVAVAARFQQPLITWDREQAARVAGVVDVHEPLAD